METMVKTVQRPKTVMEDREITVQEPRTVMESKSIQVTLPHFSHGIPYSCRSLLTLESFLPYVIDRYRSMGASA
jgi:hypothetical protein